MANFEVAFERRLPVGLLVGVHIPSERDEVPADVLAQLAPEERAAALELEGFRRTDFVGGRLAFRRAAGSLGLDGVLGVGARGEPVAPPGWTVSVSHKRPLAVALVAAAADGSIGVDVEGGDGRARMSIAERVLRPEELDVVQRLTEPEQWPAVQRTFALKEAIYKAVHPYVRRYVGFHEARVQPLGDGRFEVEMCWAEASPALLVEGAIEPLGEFLLAWARARPAR